MCRVLARLLPRLLRPQPVELSRPTVRFVEALTRGVTRLAPGPLQAISKWHPVSFSSRPLSKGEVRLHRKRPHRLQSDLHDLDAPAARAPAMPPEFPMQMAGSFESPHPVPLATNHPWLKLAATMQCPARVWVIRRRAVPANCRATAAPLRAEGARSLAFESEQAEQAPRHQFASSRAKLRDSQSKATRRSPNCRQRPTVCAALNHHSSE